MDAVGVKNAGYIYSPSIPFHIRTDQPPVSRVTTNSIASVWYHVLGIGTCHVRQISAKSSIYVVGIPVRSTTLLARGEVRPCGYEMGMVGGTKGNEGAGTNSFS